MLHANEITNYLNEFKYSGISNFNKELSILENNSLDELEKNLTVFFNDSVSAVRSKSYYLIYKKGIVVPDEKKENAVSILIKGCSDKNGGIVGNLLSYLMDFPNNSFNENSKQEVSNLLNQKKIFHYKKLAKLAGKINTGAEKLNKTFLDPKTSKEDKWISALSLSRQGSNKHTEFCLNLIKDTPIDNNSVAYLIPELIYTRQKQSVDYCIQIIYSDKKVCSSANPDKPEKILCGYRIMELIAPIIVNFPFKTNALGSLITDEYEKALEITREWLTNNPNYQIRQ